MQSISAKNREQPAGIIRETSRTLAPMALRPCLSTSLPKNCPIFLKIDMLILSTLFYHTPPRCQPVLPGFCLYSMLYFLAMWPKTFTFWCSLCFISFFVKSGRKWLGSLFQALHAGLPEGGALFVLTGRWQKAPPETDFPRPGENVTAGNKRGNLAATIGSRLRGLASPALA